MITPTRMQARFLFALGVLLSSSCATMAQEIYDYRRFTSFIETASRSAVFVKANSTGKAGTGFIMFVSADMDSSTKVTTGAAVLVTNRHLLERRDISGNLVAMSPTARVFLPLAKGGVDSATCFLMEAWKDRDLAILRPVPPLGNIDKYSVRPVYPELLAKYSEVHRGQTVFIAGFPLGLGVSGSRLGAVTQGGIVAFVDTSKDLLLLDIPINPGSSGSPAFVVTDSLHWRILGVAYAYEPSRDFALRLQTNQDSAMTQDAALDTVVVLGKHGGSYQLVPTNSSLSRVVMVTNLVEAWRKALTWVER